MHALRQEILPPSGVEFAACLKFTSSTLSDASSSTQAGRVLFNVVVARSSLLRIFEVREEPAPIPAQEDEKDRRASVRKGTEAVEGEVEMDASGEGFINVGTVKVNALRIRVPVVALPSLECHLRFPRPSLSWCRLRARASESSSLTRLSSVHRREWRSPTTYRQSLLPCPRTPAPWDRHRP